MKLQKLGGYAALASIGAYIISSVYGTFVQPSIIGSDPAKAMAAMSAADSGSPWNDTGTSFNPPRGIPYVPPIHLGVVISFWKNHTATSSPISGIQNDPRWLPPAPKKIG